MSTDVPDAGMGSPPEETWDADRVREHDTRWLAMGSTVQVTAAEHIATGELCAYNELSLKARSTASRIRTTPSCSPRTAVTGSGCS